MLFPNLVLVMGEAATKAYKHREGPKGLKLEEYATLNVCRPLRGSLFILNYSHDSRRGLHSIAPCRGCAYLPSDLFFIFNLTTEALYSVSLRLFPPDSLIQTVLMLTNSRMPQALSSRP